MLMLQSCERIGQDTFYSVVLLPVRVFDAFRFDIFNTEGGLLVTTVVVEAIVGLEKRDREKKRMSN